MIISRGDPQALMDIRRLRAARSQVIRQMMVAARLPAMFARVSAAPGESQIRSKISLESDPIRLKHILRS
jgi:hypothetical protein